MRTVNLDKKLVECEGLTQLRDYIRYAYNYILYIPIHIVPFDVQVTMHRDKFL